MLASNSKLINYEIFKDDLSNELVINICKLQLRRHKKFIYNLKEEAINKLMKQRVPLKN